jgi:hypothetical protein
LGLYILVTTVQQSRNSIILSHSLAPGSTQVDVKMINGEDNQESNLELDESQLEEEDGDS